MREKNPKERKDSYAVYDVPWVLELSNGQHVGGAFWHDRFGIEDTDGDVQLSPKDAQYLFKWATPEVPPGWHSARGDKDSPEKTLVNVRK
jgi:hypothetical protein